VGQRRHELIKRLLGLDGPGEALVLLQESVEWQSLLAEPRNEMAQGGEAPQHLLDPLKVANRAHPLEGCDLFGVGLDAPLGDDVPQQHASQHSEDALLGVQLYPVGSQAIECHAQVVNQVDRLPSFYDYIVYVSLNGLPDVISETVLHASLVCSARVSETKRHHYIAVHPEWRDE
jgi:hypothetical protein